jgi:hypothetical protein
MPHSVKSAQLRTRSKVSFVHRLRSFWEEITAPTVLWPQATGALAVWQRWTSAVMAIAFGQPGFFSPHRQTWNRSSFDGVSLRVLCLVRPSGWDGGPRAPPEAMGTPHDSAILVIQNQRVRERKAHS